MAQAQKLGIISAEHGLCHEGKNDSTGHNVVGRGHISVVGLEHAQRNHLTVTIGSYVVQWFKYPVRTFCVSLIILRRFSWRILLKLEVANIHSTVFKSHLCEL